LLHLLSHFLFSLRRRVFARNNFYFLNCLCKIKNMKTILLLFSSNIFMTFAWYWHLNHKDITLWKAILISWGIAFFEYCLTVPANRLGFFGGGFSGFQLKIVQEAITLTIFTVFAIFYLKEPFHWRYLAGFALILLAVYVMFKK
jgi:uncharacterized protein (DUF486 family)